MIRLLQIMIWGYVPMWKILEEKPLHDYADKIGGRLLSCGTRYILQCEQTGKIKFKDCI